MKVTYINSIILFSILATVIYGVTLLDKKSLDKTESAELASTNTVQKTNLLSLYKQSGNLPKHDLYCLPDSKFYCSDKGCEEVEAGVFNLIKLSGPTEISRCDRTPCGTYPATIKESGDYKIFTDGISFQIKYGSDLKYVETVSLGTDTYLSYGQCYLK